MVNFFRDWIDHFKQFYKDVFWGPWNQNRVDSWPGLIAVFGGMLLEFVTFGINDLWPMYTNSQRDDPHLGHPTKTALSLPHSMKSVFIMFFTLLAGWLLPIIGARACGFITVLSIFGFLWLTSCFANSVDAMYGTYSILGAVSIAFMWSPVIATASTWFHKYRSFATAFGIIGGGLGHLVVSPIAGAYAKNHDWRATMKYLSLFCILGLIGAILTRTRPGYQLDESINHAIEEADDTDVVACEDNINTHRFSLKEIICVVFPTRTYLALFISHFWFSLAFSATLYMVISYPMSMGHKYYSSSPKLDIKVALTLFSWWGAGHLISAFIVGVIATKFNPKRVTVFCMLLASLCGFVWSALRTYYAFGVLMMIFAGANSAINTVFPTVAGDRYFGPNIGILMSSMYWLSTGLIAPPLVTSISEKMNGCFTVPCVLIGSWHLIAAIILHFGVPELHTYAFYKRRQEQEAATLAKQNNVEEQ